MTNVGDFAIFYDDGLDDCPIRCKIHKITQHHEKAMYWLLAYVRRPDLAWHKERKFKLEYSDCRDGGYVLTLGGLMSSDKIEWSLSHYDKIKNVFFWINTGIDAMEDRLSKNDAD